jgi:acetyltransferase-like isoleucine patch superfamily enzyme
VGNGTMLFKLFDKIQRFVNRRVLTSKFKKFGKNVTLMKPYMLTSPQYIEIEDNVFIREYSRIEAIVTDGCKEFKPILKIKKGAHIEQFFHVGACEYVEIGENVLIAGRVYISDHNHRFSDVDKPILAQGIESGGKVIIEENAWLGEGCVVLPGVTIGKNAIIGSNAVVTKNIPPYSIAVGIPARVIKRYDTVSNSWKPIV